MSIILFQTPEERWASSLWETPLYVGPVRIKEAIFVPCAPIFPDGGISRLILHDGLEDLGILTIVNDIRRFQVCYFELGTSEGKVSKKGILILRKELSMGRNVAISNGLVQVTLWD